MRLRAVTIYWDEERDTASVVWNAQFLALDWLDKADALKDAIYELNKRYEEVVIDGRR